MSAVDDQRQAESSSLLTPRGRFDLAAEAPRDRAELAALAAGMVRSVGPFFSPGSARLRLGSAGQMYARDGAELESFSRQLWAVSSLLGGGFEAPWADRFAEGMLNGTDPEHPEFWGMDAPPMQQPCVERPAVAFALVEARASFWDPLSTAQRERVFEWLNWINECELHANNWRYFRLLTNAAFARLGLPVDARRVEEDRDLLESFYCGDGWYTDGATERIDYYLPWAFHFYNGLLCRWEADSLPGMAGFGQLALERARAFAPEFARWFDAEGRALPFGRSLTYRFAQTAFWGLPALVNESIYPVAAAKGLFLRNLRWWCGRPILTDGGLLSIGYGYAQPGMAEGYNAPGSPYWANKAFLPLLAAEAHPFWTANEAPLESEETDANESVVVQKPIGWHLAKADGGRTLIALNGKVSPYDLENDYSRFAGKYAKLGYSTRAGFNLASGGRGLGHAGVDATLAFSLGGGLWRTRDQARLLRQDATGQLSEWVAGPGWTVRLWQGFVNDCLIRLFRLHAEVGGTCVEGGWPIAFHHEPGEDRCEWIGGDGPEGREDATGLILGDKKTATALLDCFGNRRAEWVDAFPNTNLMHPSTRIPCLRFAFEPGEHRFASIQPLSFEPRGVKAVLNHPRKVQWEEQSGRFTIEGEPALF